MWICIVVACQNNSNSCWLVALTHAAFKSNVPSILPERGHEYTDFTRITFISMSKSKNIGGQHPTGPHMLTIFLFKKIQLLILCFYCEVYFLKLTYFEVDK